MSVSLITHYSDYYDTDYWILFFTVENKTYHVKFVLCCPLESIQ